MSTKNPPKKNPIVQNFRARLRRKGYRNISIKFIGQVDVFDPLMGLEVPHYFYSFSAYDPLGFAVQGEFSDAQMARWLVSDSQSRGGAIFV